MSIGRGALIVIEGVDRSGKTTQCRKLVKSLNDRNIRTELMNFPDRSTLTGELISHYLKDKTCTLNDKAIHLLFSANRWENHDKMKELLENGCSLIVDRYSYSGVAFSSIKKVGESMFDEVAQIFSKWKILSISDMDLRWCLQPEVGLIKPDLVLLMTLSDEVMLNRPGFGNERYENVEMQKSVKEVFQTFADNEDNWKVINAAGTIEAVHQKLLREIISKIEEIGDSPLEKLEFSGKYHSEFFFVR